jgi:hypothetical protein
MSNLTSALTSILLLAGLDVHGAWERMAIAPHSSRALAINSGGAIFGFAADRKEPLLFSIVSGKLPKTTPLDTAPQFYAYAHDARGTKLCVVLHSNSADQLVCFDHTLRRAETAPIVIPMTSGAIASAAVLWVVDPSGTKAPKEASLVRLQRSASGWSEAERWRSPLCEHTQSHCGELEIHPIDERTLAVIPLLGTSDGESVHYPMVGIWNSLSGVVKRIPAPILPIPQPLLAEYRSLGKTPLRLVYRSAASAQGKIAIIPALPAPDIAGIKRDQLWIYDGGSQWHCIPAPGPLNAVAFAGEDPIVVTSDGVILRWKR